MASTARGFAGAWGPLDAARFTDLLLGRAAFAGVPAGGAEATTMRSLAGAGLTGLVGLPVLMLASLLLHAPLAGPAAIALGYLAAAKALAQKLPRRAAAWSFGASAALALWGLFVFALAGPFSTAGLVSVLLAPLFAASPALARRLLRDRADPVPDAARTRAACLDQLAPSEPVLFLDDEGTILCATQAGRRMLRLGCGAVGGDVSRLFGIAERPALLAALARCRTDGEEAILMLRREREAGLLTATIASGADGGVTLRLAAGEEVVERVQAAATATACDATPPTGAAHHDLREAIDFALQRLPNEAAKRINLACEASGIRVAADRRLCRHLAHRMIEAALAAAAPGSEITVAARSLKGAVLLRVGFEGPAPADMARLAALADLAGGSLVAERAAGRSSISLRLASAAAR
jgi:hypothetical protein